MKFRSLSITGPKGENQDAILSPFRISNSFWCAIADGVGSSSRGGIAARACLEVVQNVAGHETMPDLFAMVHETLSKIPRVQEPGASISTTLSVLSICGNRAFVGHVGDTRISHYRGAGVMGRTTDQTEIQKLLDDGVMTKHQAARYPRRNVLLSAMSAERSYDLQKHDFEVQVGDRILLTSDGFHTKLPRRKIAHISSSNSEFEEFWNALQSEISQIKFDDDASCLAIEIETEDA